VVEVVELEETYLDHKMVPSMGITRSKVANIGDTPYDEGTPEH
jgi:hypothetical protein